MKDVGGGGSFCLMNAPPDQVASVPGSRQRDIEKPQILGQDFLLGEHPVPRVSGRIDHQFQPPLICRIVKSKFPVLLDRRAGPGEGARYDGVLQTFALVNGDHPDGVGVALQAELVLFEARHVLVALVGEPFQQAQHSRFLSVAS